MSEIVPFVQFEPFAPFPWPGTVIKSKTYHLPAYHICWNSCKLADAAVFDSVWIKLPLPPTYRDNRGIQHYSSEVCRIHMSASCLQFAKEAILERMAGRNASAHEVAVFIRQYHEHFGYYLSDW